MKLLLDQNLSYKLCSKLADLFPESDQIRRLGLERADDQAIWQYAKANGFVIVTQDADFADYSALYGSPPKVIWLRCGNQPTENIERLLRDHADTILALAQQTGTDCLEIR
jgi:predicted nuclease of predicted toxin-antitoxin system